VKAYTQFVKNVSATYRPSPQVFLTVSHCAGKNESEKYCADTKAAFESMKAAGLDNVHLLDITVNGTGAWDTPPGTIGCDRHPSQTAHALMGRIAAPKVKAAMGWKTDDTPVFRRAGTSPVKSVQDVEKVRDYCETDADCGYNGLCTGPHPTMVCTCHPAWRGRTCGSLNLLPMRPGAGLNGSDAGGPISSWGGTVNAGDGDGKWHMHVAQFVGHCGFNGWATSVNSCLSFSARIEKV